MAPSSCATLENRKNRKQTLDTENGPDQPQQKLLMLANNVKAFGSKATALTTKQTCHI